jgi:hypothetical protein
MNYVPLIYKVIVKRTQPLYKQEDRAALPGIFYYTTVPGTLALPWNNIKC